MGVISHPAKSYHRRWNDLRDQVNQAISIIKPKMVFLYMVSDTPSEKVIETSKEKYPAVKFSWAHVPGQRFHYEAN